MRIRDRQRAELGFAAANAVAALLTGLTVFWGLPLHSLWVEVPAGLVTGVLVVSSAALLGGFRRALWVARIAGHVLLAWGLLATAGLVLGATFLRVTAGIGSGDAFRLIALSLAFAAAYWIVYPLVLLAWLRTRRDAGATS